LEVTKAPFFGTTDPVRCVGITRAPEEQPSRYYAINFAGEKLPGQGSNLRMVESKSTALPLGYRALRTSGIILKKKP
jgi:hypothetical protein